MILLGDRRDLGNLFVPKSVCLQMSRNAKIPALTGLRAVAASLVFFYHCFFQYVDELPLWLGALFNVGYVGVPIFFALSGFLITLRYLDDFGEGKIGYGRFFTRIPCCLP